MMAGLPALLAASVKRISADFSLEPFEPTIIRTALGGYRARHEELGGINENHHS